MMSVLTYTLLSASLLGVLYWLYGLRNCANVQYPPGPKGMPLIGNIFDISTNKPWIGLASLGKKYGGIVYLRVFGKHILVINSREDAFELLDKRSKIYSDRADIPAVEMMGWGFDDHGVIVVHYRLPGSIIMKVVYNIDISEEEHQYYVEVAQQAEKNLGDVAYLSAILPTAFPLIHHIPDWVPGVGSLQRIILETKLLTHKMLTAPFDSAQKNRDPSSSVVMRLLTDANEIDGDDHKRAIQDVCATAYAAGVDTSEIAIQTFFCAMLVSPDVLKKAQAEIDEVIGNSRLPNFDDRDSLHYVEALYREVLRWHSIGPLNLPRVATMDDVYNGYFIPKGTMVIPNAWAMAHDETVYHNPDQFLPERFINEDGELNDDASDLAFGFGRRVCPGRYLARDTVWLTIATTLAVFDIRHVKDEHGNDIPVAAESTNDLLSRLEPFECSVTPRSDAARSLIVNSISA